MSTETARAVLRLWEHWEGEYDIEHEIVAAGSRAGVNVIAGEDYITTVVQAARSVIGEAER